MTESNYITMRNELLNSGFAVETSLENIVSNTGSGTFLISVTYIPQNKKIYSGREDVSHAENIITTIFNNRKSIARICEITHGTAVFSKSLPTNSNQIEEGKLDFSLLSGNKVELYLWQQVTPEVEEILQLYSPKLLDWLLSLLELKRLNLFKEILAQSLSRKLIIDSVKVKGEQISVFVVNSFSKAIYVYKGNREIAISDEIFNLALNKIELLKSL